MNRPLQVGIGGKEEDLHPRSMNDRYFGTTLGAPVAIKLLKLNRKVPMRAVTFGFRRHELEQKLRRVPMLRRAVPRVPRKTAEPTQAKEKSKCPSVF
jgi:hypothetical protein